MAVDSGTYDQATVARHQKIAEAMWNDAFKPKPIRHWAEGVSQLAETGLAGYLGNKADAEARGLKAQDTAALASLLGGSSATPTASPVSPETSAVPTTPPGGAPMAAAPMGSAVASAMSPAGPPVNIPRPEVTPTAKVWGDKEAEDAGLYEKPTAAPQGGAKVAAALGGNAPMPAPAPVASAPTAPPSGGLLANATPGQKAAIAAGIGASPDSPANKIAMAMITKLAASDTAAPISVGGKLVSPQGKVIYDGGEDKTPAGFRKTDSGLEPIPGGPADVAYLRLKAAKEKDPNGTYVLGRGGEVIKNNPDGTVTVLHKNEQEGGQPLTDDAVDFAAKRAIAADPKALTNLGRGQQGRADLAKINNRIAEIMRDDPNGAKTIMDNAAKQAGLVSSSRALGTKETHFGVAEKAMEESIPVAQAASDALPRSDWVHFNKLVQLGQTEHSNPLLRRALIATDTAAKDYARTINPTGALRESDIEYARKIISVADGPETYRAALDQLRIEAGVMHRAIQRQKKELHGGSGSPETSAPAAAVPATTVRKFNPATGKIE